MISFLKNHKNKLLFSVAVSATSFLLFKKTTEKLTNLLTNYTNSIKSKEIIKKRFKTNLKIIISYSTDLITGDNDVDLLINMLKTEKISTLKKQEIWNNIGLVGMFCLMFLYYLLLLLLIYLFITIINYSY